MVMGESGSEGFYLLYKSPNSQNGWVFWSIIFDSSAIRVAPKNRTRLFGGHFGLAGRLYHTEGQGVPAVLVADEQHHFLPVGAFVDFSGTEAPTLEYSNASPSVILPREVFKGLGGIGGSLSKQLVDTYPNDLCHRRQERHVGTGELSFPLGHGFPGNIKRLGKCFLGQPFFFAQRL